MKEIVKTIKTVITLGFILICACLVDNKQVKAAEPTPEAVIDMTQMITVYIYSLMTARVITGKIYLKKKK